jgi:hypothetical protein
MEEIDLKLTPQQAMRVAGNQARLQVANDCMTEVLVAYRTVAEREQQRFDVLMESICEANDVKLPDPYEYFFDPNVLGLRIRPRGIIEPPASLLDSQQN